MSTQHLTRAEKVTALGKCAFVLHNQSVRATVSIGGSLKSQSFIGEVDPSVHPWDLERGRPSSVPSAELSVELSKVLQVLCPVLPVIS